MVREDVSQMVTAGIDIGHESVTVVVLHEDGTLGHATFVIAGEVGAVVLADPVILTTDADFRVYRRHGQQVIPCRTPYCASKYIRRWCGAARPPN